MRADAKGDSFVSKLIAGINTKLVGVTAATEVVRVGTGWTPTVAGVRLGIDVAVAAGECELVGWGALVDYAGRCSFASHRGREGAVIVKDGYVAGDILAG